MTFFIQFPFSSSSCSHTPIPIGRPSSYPPSSKGTPQVSDVSPLSLSSTPPEVSCIVLFQKISIPSPCKTYWFRAPPPPPPPPPLTQLYQKFQLSFMLSYKMLIWPLDPPLPWNFQQSFKGWVEIISLATHYREKNCLRNVVVLCAGTSPRYKCI